MWVWVGNGAGILNIKVEVAVIGNVLEGSE